MSHTRPEEAHHVKKGSHVMLKGHPCKIVDVKTSKTGKHGHAKCNITGIDVLYAKKYNEVHPGHIILGAFDPIKKEYELVNLDEKENFVEVMDEAGTQTQFPLERGVEVVDKLVAAYDPNSSKVIQVTIITAPVGETETQLVSVIESWKFEADT